MGAVVLGKPFEEGAQREERGQRDLRRAHQLEEGAPLAGRHPFGDDGARAVTQETEEYPFSREGGNALAVYCECLAIPWVPGIVDGDRP